MSNTNDSNLLFQAFSASPVATMILDSTGVIVTANPAVEPLFSRTTAEMLGHHLGDVYPAGADLGLIERALLQRRSIDAVTTVDVRDQSQTDEQSGRTRYWQCRVVPFGSDTEQFSGALLLIEDVTQETLLKKEFLFNYEMLHSALQHLSIPVVRTNDENRIVFANNAYYTTFGTSTDACLGCDVRESGLPEEFYTRWEKNHRLALERGEERSFWFEYSDASETRRFYAEIAPEPALSGKARSSIMFVTDVSEAVEREEELENLLVEMNHRIKNNLANIEALARIEMNVGDKTKEDAINDILGRIQAIVQVHQTLYETKSFAAVAIGPYLEELLQSVIGSSAVATISSSIRFDEIDVTTKTATKLGLMVVELVTNTIKYAECDGECTVDLAVSNVGEEVVVRYADSGKGFGPDVRSIDDIDAGTGMMILHALASDLEGSIELHPKNSGESAEFLIRFPRAGNCPEVG